MTTPVFIICGTKVKNPEKGTFCVTWADFMLTSIGKLENTFHEDIQKLCEMLGNGNDTAEEDSLDPDKWVNGFTWKTPIRALLDIDNSAAPWSIASRYNNSIVDSLRKDFFDDVFTQEWENWTPEKLKKEYAKRFSGPAILIDSQAYNQIAIVDLVNELPLYKVMQYTDAKENSFFTITNTVPIDPGYYEEGFTVALDFIKALAGQYSDIIAIEREELLE